ncbi:hypothetical protein WJX72_001131 [[Myrmecia] bisecta]|uniref:Photosystem II reaction center X protein n=1 Tax=[Myrmecia] bisecta TaxID=41462 RepID=A0AAW1PE36_9CHLO
MAVTALAPAASAVSAPRLAARKAVSGVSVARVARPAVCRVNRRVMASAEQKQVAPAAVTAAVASLLASPLAAQAGTTPSLQNLLYSVVAGGAVLGAIALAITAVSNFDPLSRSGR